MGRLLTLEGTEFRWSARGQRTLADGQHHVVVSVVLAEATRQVLRVLVRHDSPWLHVQVLARARAAVRAVADLGLVTRPVRPALVSKLIAMAHAVGWDARQRGATLEFVLVEDERLVPLAEWESQTRRQ